jgi:hypothetical protein
VEPIRRSPRRRRQADGKRAWRATVVVLAALVLLAGCGSAQRRSADAGIPGALLSQARPIGRGPRFRPPATGPVIGRCHRRLGLRYGVHVEVFAADRVVLIPAGMGTRPPRTFSAGRISAASCFGELVTLEPTGVVLVRPGARLFTGDLFRAWGQSLSRGRLLSFRARSGTRIAVFVGGRRWPGRPESVPLVRHAEIVLEVGPFVPPHPSYTFPPGV